MKVRTKRWSVFLQTVIIPMLIAGLVLLELLAVWMERRRQPIQAIGLIQQAR
jgi:hypothetical protein